MSFFGFDCCHQRVIETANQSRGSLCSLRSREPTHGASIGPASAIPPSAPSTILMASRPETEKQEVRDHQNNAASVGDTHASRPGAVARGPTPQVPSVPSMQAPKLDDAAVPAPQLALQQDNSVPDNMAPIVSESIRYAPSLDARKNRITTVTESNTLVPPLLLDRDPRVMDLIFRGYAEEDARTAIEKCSTVEEAVEWLAANPAMYQKVSGPKTRRPLRKRDSEVLQWGKDLHDSMPDHDPKTLLLRSFLVREESGFSQDPRYN